MKPREYSNEEGAGSGCMARLVRILQLNFSGINYVAASLRKKLESFDYRLPVNYPSAFEKYLQGHLTVRVKLDSRIGGESREISYTSMCNNTSNIYLNPSPSRIHRLKLNVVKSMDADAGNQCVMLVQVVQAGQSEYHSISAIPVGLNRSDKTEKSRRCPNKLGSHHIGQLGWGSADGKLSLKAGYISVLPYSEGDEVIQGRPKIMQHITSYCRYFGRYLCAVTKPYHEIPSLHVFVHADGIWIIGDKDFSEIFKITDVSICSCELEKCSMHIFIPNVKHIRDDG